MSETTGIVVTGASGRMGQMLIRMVLESDAARLAGAVDRPGHDWIGLDVGEAMGGGGGGVGHSEPGGYAVKHYPDVKVKLSGSASAKEDSATTRTRAPHDRGKAISPRGMMTLMRYPLLLVSRRVGRNVGLDFASSRDRIRLRSPPRSSRTWFLGTVDLYVRVRRVPKSRIGDGGAQEA